MQRAQTFRLDGKHLFLTYPKCDLSIDDTFALIQLKAESIRKVISKWCIARERHADGTWHLHVYIELAMRHNFSNPRFWDLEDFHGNYQTCRNPSRVVEYCTKDENYRANFDVKKLRKFTRARVGQELLDGKDLIDVVSEWPQLVFDYGKIKHNLNIFRLDKQEPYTADDVRGVWIWGPPGVGKSHRARNWEAGVVPYIKSQNKWWCGYAGESIVVMDDLDSPALGHYLKIWADKWSCIGETKGGTVGLRYKVFIVTSNYHPGDDQLWGGDDKKELRTAIIRRFKFIHIVQL